MLYVLLHNSYMKQDMEGTFQEQIETSIVKMFYFSSLLFGD